MHGLFHSPVVPPVLSCGTTWSSSRHFATSPFHLSCLSPSLLLAWVSGSSLTPWLSDIHTILFSGSSGCFLFLNLLLSFFWLCEEAQCVYLHLHLGWRSTDFFFLKKTISCSSHLLIGTGLVYLERQKKIWNGFGCFVLENDLMCLLSMDIQGWRCI